MTMFFKGSIIIMAIFDLLVILMLGIDFIKYEIGKRSKKKKDVDDEEEFLDLDFTPNISTDVIRCMCSLDVKDFVKERICERDEMKDMNEEEKEGAVLLLSSYISFLREDAPVDEQNFPMLLYMLNYSKVSDEYEYQDAVEYMLKESSVDKSYNKQYYYDYLSYKAKTPNRAKVLDLCRITVNQIALELYGEFKLRYYISDMKYKDENILNRLDDEEVEY